MSFFAIIFQFFQKYLERRIKLMTLLTGAVGIAERKADHGHTSIRI